jgi:hypothetical protein
LGQVAAMSYRPVTVNGVGCQAANDPVPGADQLVQAGLTRLN